jgi:hypothetical protein
MYKQPKDTYTTQQVADYLGVDYWTVLRWLKKDNCPIPRPIQFHANSKPFYFNVNEIHAFKRSVWMGSDE